LGPVGRSFYKRFLNEIYSHLSMKLAFYIPAAKHS
jgi:hypothetical protein